MKSNIPGSYREWARWFYLTPNTVEKCPKASFNYTNVRRKVRTFNGRNVFCEFKSIIRMKRFFVWKWNLASCWNCHRIEWRGAPPPYFFLNPRYLECTTISSQDGGGLGTCISSFNFIDCKICPVKTQQSFQGCVATVPECRKKVFFLIIKFRQC